MKLNDLVGQVQRDAKLPSFSDSTTAIRATLETLGERITEDQAAHLSSQLPREVGYFLYRGAISFGSKRFGYREFIERVARRECVSNARAAFHARVVMEAIGEGASLEELAEKLPPDYAALFTGNVEAPANEPAAENEEEAVDDRIIPMPKPSSRSKRQLT